MLALPKSKLFWACSVFVALIAAYGLFGFYVAPGVIREQAQTLVHDRLGRDLTIGEVRFNPFLLKLEVREVSLPDTDGQRMLGLERLLIDFEVKSLWSRAFTFREVAIEAPTVRAVIRPNGSMNLSDLSSSSKPETAPDADRSLPSIWIEKLDMGRGSIEFVDQSRTKPFTHQLRDVGFELADFRTTAQGGDFQFSAQGAQTATIDWQGRFALSPHISSHGEFRIDALPVSPLLEFLGDAVPFTSTKGTIHLAGTYRVALAKEAQVEVTLPTIEVRDTSFLARGASEPWLQIPSLAVSDLKAMLPARTVNVGHIGIDSLRAQTVLNADRSLNLVSLFTPPTAPATATVKAAPAPTANVAQEQQPPWSVQIGDITLNKATIDFEDRAIAPGTRLQIAPLDVSISGASLDLSRPLAMKVAARIDGDTQLDIKGTLTPQPFAASLDLSLAKARLSLLKPYALPSANLTVTAGSLDAAGKVELALPSGKQPELSFMGEATVNGFKSIDNALKQDFLNVAKLRVSKIRYATTPAALSIDAIDIDEPSTRLVISREQVLNVNAVLNPTSAVSSTDARPKGSPPPRQAQAVPSHPMPVSIREVRVDRMRLNFTDLYIQPSFSADIQQLSGTVSGLSSAPGKQARLALKGTLGEFTPVAIAGQLEPFAFDRNTDMQLRFEGIQLPILNPYSGSFTGYNIAKGQLTTELRYLIENRRLDAKHMIRVDQLEWGEATESKQAASLPVRLATSLLKDRHGVITLDIPVGGNLDEPTFRVGPIVWQVVTNIITKSVTAPFSVLGSLFAGAEEAQFIDFQPGEAALAPAAGSRLTALGKSLVERPELKLDVPVATLAELDRPALVDRAFKTVLADYMASRTGNPDGGAGSTYAALEANRKIEVLSALLIAKTGSVPKLPQATAEGAPSGTPVDNKEELQNANATVGLLERALKASITVTDAELSELGEARARAMQQALLSGTGLTPARVFKVLDVEPAPNAGQVRVALALK